MKSWPYYSPQFSKKSRVLADIPVDNAKHLVYMFGPKLILGNRENNYETKHLRSFF